MKLLMVSGGGGGSNASYGSGGGGGGGVIYQSAFSIITNKYYVEIGGGGAINTGGDVTIFGPEIVYGGAGGNTAANAYGGGGGGTNGTAGGAGKAGGAYGYAGGPSISVGGGGGGGAGAAGGTSVGDGGGTGGTGYSCDITGTALIYGEGGGGGYGGACAAGVGGRGATGPGTVGSGLTNRGGGGGGNYYTYGAGTGGSGVVIVSYVTSEWGTCTGGTITTSGIYTVHTFTSNGTFTVVHAIKKIAGVAPISSISLDTTSLKTNGASNLNHCTWSHTVGSGTDRVLIVFVPVSQAVTVSSVTYDGDALSLFVSTTNGNPKAYIYYKKAPAVGAANIVVTFSGTLQWLLASAASFFGVNQGTYQLTNYNTKTGTAQNRDPQLYNPYGGWILECMGDGGTVNTAASGQTVITTANRISSYDTGVTIGNHTQSWTGNTSMSYAWVGCSLIPTHTHLNKVAGITGATAKKIMGVGNR